MELFQEMDINPEITCPYPKGNAENCKVCKYSKSEYLCDITARKVDYLIANGVIVPTYKAGDEIWVVERENGEAVDISGYMFLANSKGCIIATYWIDDYDLDETLKYHINETQDNRDTKLVIYPENDCFATKEAAEKALRGEGE